MITLGELALMMEASARRAPEELTAEVRHLVDEAVADSQAMIGHEGNEGWAPLKDATIAEKERLGFTGRISASDPLARTFEMRDSITGAAERTAEGVEAGFGSDDEVALFQETGTPKLPPRPFIAPASIRAVPKIEKTLGELASTLLFPALLR